MCSISMIFYMCNSQALDQILTLPSVCFAELDGLLSIGATAELN